MSISVLGLGNWGTALAEHLARRGHDVVAWSKDNDVVDSINRTHRNPRYLSDFTLTGSLKATSSLEEVAEREVLLLAFSSSALAEMIPRFSRNVRRTVVSGIKGIDFASLLTPLQLTEQHLGDSAQYVVISGPSFASDVIARRPAGIVCASATEEVASQVASLFADSSLKMYVSTDPLGVELGGIVKNVIALATGVSDGLGYGDSAKAGLITRGLAEMARLAHAMGAHDRTLYGLAGLGDLAMTCSSDLSRNRTVGVRLGRGEDLATILNTLGSVAEGVRTTPAVLELARKYKVEMPITEQVGRLLRGEDSAMGVATTLLSRPTRKEF